MTTSVQGNDGPSMGMGLLQVRMVIRPQRAEAVWQRLLDWGRIEQLYASEISGAGRRFEHGGVGGEQLDLLPKVQIGGFVDREDVDELVELVLEEARGGRIGDGKIFLLPVLGEVH